jgi:small subunit ribosomal protein S13
MSTMKPKGEKEEKVKDEKLTEKQDDKKDKHKHRIDKPAELRSIVRVVNTDLNGEKPLFMGIMKIRGIGFAMSKAVCQLAELDPRKKLSDLNEQEIIRLEAVLKDPLKHEIPLFFANRRNDIETGKNMHLIGVDLDVSKKFDIQRHVDMKTYRGWRHMLGQPVRGQRTRSSFRGTGKSVGVMKKDIKAAAAPKAGEATKSAGSEKKSEKK